MNLRETMVQAGEELRRIREEQHITQQEMEKRTAERFGHDARVYAQQVSRIEKGQLDKPPILDLLRVGQVLGLSSDDILDLYRLRPGQRARKATAANALQRLDPRLRAVIALLDELPDDARERFLSWIEFATLQARAEQRTAARTAAHPTSGATGDHTPKAQDASNTADGSTTSTSPNPASSTRSGASGRVRTHV